MLTQTMENAFNVQINREFYSKYLYLSMAAYFQEVGLSGFANWMRVQVEEENAHAMAMFDYVLSRGGKVVLKEIEKPQHTWNNALDVFESTLAHETQVTAWINELAEVSEKEKDRASTAYLQWFINEQVEEEANSTEIIAKLKLINLNGDALFSMDKDLGARVFVPPIIK